MVRSMEVAKLQLAALLITGHVGWVQTSARMSLRDRRRRQQTRQESDMRQFSSQKQRGHGKYLRKDPP